MPPKGSTRARIVPGCPSLDRGSRETEVGFDGPTIRSVNPRSNNLIHLAHPPSGAPCIRQLVSLSSPYHEIYPYLPNFAHISVRLAVMPPEGRTRAGILPGCPNLARSSREAEVGFESRTFRLALLPLSYLAI
ncbi:hypothetical protein T265_07266 [Opisthorchis viverrini]|uniref:Uncharacterized protein n=1 Tax=Opisthorchis viverrini TaxID=6198 RepID=A0A075AC18_OPIVI|nr:hypothetical protein T265_07266 [Opisthorchis viverrini]KER25224.1 hypothetical protein T265_07266 [Opisthorchis viverrini]